MSKAIRIYEHGGPEVMKWEDVDVAAPAAGEARIKQSVVGLNYLDTYHRSGQYKLPMPTGLGMEGAGVVEAVGAGVTSVKPGDRVAYCMGAPGAYAELRNMPADRLVILPAGVTEKQSAAMMLKGMTAQYLTRRTFKVQPGQTVLFHAAAGGVGLIACQWLKALGVTVIGTVSSDEKAAQAKAHGCDHPIVYTREDFVARVKEITNGAGVPVVYDSVGKDTFMKSLDCLAPFGTLALFGQSSGAVPPLDLGLLAAKGSLFVTRPTLGTYGAKRSDLEMMANELFDIVKSGKVKIEINHEYALKDAVKAHQDLEARKTTGSVVLLT